MNYHNERKTLIAFTLVELIVVIVIIGILATIGFVSYRQYLVSSRDSNRLTQLVKISEGLTAYAQNTRLPLPENPIELTASGAVFFYQGVAGPELLDLINLQNGGLDPKTQNPFTYTITSDRRKHQLLTFLEEESSFSPSKTYAASSNKHLFPQTYGNRLGILLNPDTHVPINETLTGPIEIFSTPESFTIIYADDDIVTASGDKLYKLIPNISCDRIEEIQGGQKNSYYILFSKTEGKKRVYCNMEKKHNGVLQYFLDPSELIYAQNFDENLEDFSGNKIEATKTPDFTYSDDAIFGSAGDFTATGSTLIKLIGAAMQEHLNPKKVSISAWLKYDVLSGYPHIFFKRDTTELLDPNFSTKGYAFILQGPDRMIMSAPYHRGNNPGDSDQADVTRAIPISSTGSYHHFVGIVDGPLRKVYFNGKQMGTTYDHRDVHNNHNMDIEVSSTKPIIGKNVKGMMDNLRVYNRALTQGEIELLYYEGLGKID